VAPMKSLLLLVCLLAFAVQVQAFDREFQFCTECIPLMDDVVNFATSNTTYEDIGQMMAKVCDILPEFIRAYCLEGVAEFIDFLAYNLIPIGDEYTGYDICTVLSLCASPCCLNANTPEQIHLSLTGNYTQMAVVWVTQGESPQPTVEWGTSATQLKYSSVGKSDTYMIGGWMGYIHTAVMTGLSASTQYYYRVGDPKKLWMEQAYFPFVSAPNPTTSLNETFVFAAYGDMGATDISDPTVLKLTELAQRRKINAVIHAGDISYANGVQYVFDDFFRKIEPISAYVPYMVAPGNHESGFNFTAYKHRFAMPAVESDSDTNMYSSFNYGNIHVIAYNAEEDHGLAPNLKPGGEEYNWIEQDLIKANANRAQQPWIMVFGHRPFYCSSQGQSGDIHNCDTNAVRLRSFVEDLFFNYQVDLVFTAHLHDYERTWPVYQEVAYPNYNNPGAPVYVVCGAAGNQEFLEDDWEYPAPVWSAGPRIAEYGFCMLHVNATALTVEFVADSNGQTLDSFTITKS